MASVTRSRKESSYKEANANHQRLYMLVDKRYKLPIFTYIHTIACIYSSREKIFKISHPDEYDHTHKYMRARARTHTQARTPTYTGETLKIWGGFE